jgi:uncharacterized membrane protein
MEKKNDKRSNKLTISLSIVIITSFFYFIYFYLYLPEEIKKQNNLQQLKKESIEKLEILFYEDESKEKLQNIELAKNPEEVKKQTAKILKKIILEDIEN